MRRHRKGQPAGLFGTAGTSPLTFALEHPKRVDRLILNGANLDPSGVKRSVQIPIVLGYGLTAVLARFSPEARAQGGAAAPDGAGTAHPALGAGSNYRAHAGDRRNP